jgi:hypothetical protein
VADNEGTILNPADSEFTNKLRKVAIDAALRAKGDVDGARALLPDLRAIPFSLEAVGDEALVGKCASADGNDPG